MAGLAGLAVVLVSIPFDLAFRLEVKDRAEFSLRWKWLFGLIDRGIKTGRSVRSSGKKPERDRSGLLLSTENLRTGIDLLQTRGLIQQMMRLMKMTLRSIKIKQVEADFLAGMEDPADTFYLFTLMGPLNLLFGRFRNCRVNLRASFAEPACEGYITAVLRLYPVQLIIPGMEFVFSLAVFRLIKKWVSMRWKKHRPRWRVQSQPAA